MRRKQVLLTSGRTDALSSRNGKTVLAHAPAACCLLPAVAVALVVLTTPATTVRSQSVTNHDLVALEALNAVSRPDLNTSANQLVLVGEARNGRPGCSACG